jgi:hypothetical protein
VAGCGTTKWSDTSRTATEQLLLSDAMDRAVSRIDFQPVAGRKAYLDSKPVEGMTDSAYLVSLVRQHMLASGCVLQDDRERADYVVELRAGTVGTNRREVLFGVPASKLPDAAGLPGVPSEIPEIALAKKTEQQAVTKVAVFAYNRHTGHPLWQSGTVPIESVTKNIWFFGAGPFQRGSIHKGTKFAGEKISIPLITRDEKGREKLAALSVCDEATFAEQPSQMASRSETPQPAPGGPQPNGTPAANLAQPPAPAIPAGYPPPGYPPAVRLPPSMPNGTAVPQTAPPQYLAVPPQGSAPAYRPAPPGCQALPIQPQNQPVANPSYGYPPQ